MLPPLLSTLLRRQHGHRHSLRRFLLQLHCQPCRLFSTTTSSPLNFPLSHPTYMIWGSNTSLGKTLVSAGLASSFLLSPPAQCSSGRRKFVYLKPVQTGFPSDSDSHFVFAKLSAIASRCNLPFSFLASNSVLKSSLSAAKSVVSIGGHLEINNLTFGMHDLNFHESNAVLSDGDSVSELVSKTLYAWREAVSPHLAAERENGVVEDSAVVEMLQQCLINDLEVKGENEKMDVFCVVETAGGVASPGPSGTLQCDMYRPFRFPGVLVGDGRLGGISGTISAYESLKLRGYDIVAVVFEDHGLVNEMPLISYLRNRVHLEVSSIKHHRVHLQLPIMEKPTPPQNEQHPAFTANPVFNQDQPPTYNNRDFSSPLAQPPLTNPGSPPPAHIHNPNDFPPQSQGQPPQSHGQPPQQNANSVPLQSLQSQSAPVVCPSCGVRDFTVTTAEAGGFTHAAAALVCFVSCLGCIPYCISSLKDVHHRCANCGVPLADYHRSGRTEVRCWQK